jgi:hypothetical protein
MGRGVNGDLDWSVRRERRPVSVAQPLIVRPLVQDGLT